jgi:hypothetical protein
MKKLITLLVLGLVLTSCGSQYQLSTLNHEPEYIGDVRVDIIDNEFQLARKLRTDDRFRWDFAQYAMNQDMRWNYDFYFSNRMYRSGFDSPFSFQWNSHQYWWNWANNSHFNMGFNHWDPFGFNNYGMGWSYSWGNNSWSSNQWGNGYGWNNYYGYGWNNNGWNNGYRRGSNVAYHSGRRGSSNVIVGKRTNVIKDRVIISRNNPRIVNNTDVVIDKELIKLKRNNPNIRVIRNTNNNSKPIRNYNRIENNSNNNINRNNNNTIPINNSRPVRTYTPPTRSTTPVRTNGNTNVIRGGKPNVKR